MDDTGSTGITALIIRLPDDMAMSKGETLSVKLVPAVGITRSIELKSPIIFH